MNLRCKPWRAPQAIIFRRTSEDRLKRSYNTRVELTLDSLRKSQARNATWHSIAVRSVRGHGVVGICNGDDTRQKWDRISSKAIRISFSIDAFMMMPDDGCDLSVRIDI
jgi:hypothetical protein